MSKAISAATAALAIYNQPNLDFREEAFCQLIVAAWEALLKARILKENKNKFSCLFLYEKSKDGTGSANAKAKTRIKRNRSGNELTIGINKCLDIVRQYKTDNVDSQLISNLHSLIEIRDNSAHLINLNLETAEQIHITGTTAVVNFLKAVEHWFQFDISKLKFVPLPIGYLEASTTVLVSKKKNRPQSKLVQFLSSEPLQEKNTQSHFNSRIHIAVYFNKDIKSNALPMRITDDPTAPAVQLKEEDWGSRYPLTHAEVIREVKKIEPSMKQNSKFNNSMRQLESQPAFCYIRLIDPKKPRGGKKRFYSNAVPPRIVKSMQPA